MPQYSFIEIKQPAHTFKLTAIPARQLAEISYAAVRRQDDEAGAVQRILITSRIAGIKEFALQRGDFPASIVLNWVGDDLNVNGNFVEIPNTPRSAQIIDGQHRVAGIAEAMKEEPEIGETLIPVAIYAGLNTEQSAQIFLSINTEQRPVPKSLVFDLYGIAGDELMDLAALRSRDIIAALSKEGEPYEGFIKYPNQGYKRGGIALSTAVDTIKPLVEFKGSLEQAGINSLELQTAVFQNFFRTIQNKYEGFWNEKTNAMIYAAGFIGSIQFFRHRLVDYCVQKRSFEASTMDAAISMNTSNRILQEEIRGLGGSEAANKVFERFTQMFSPQDIVADIRI